MQIYREIDNHAKREIKKTAYFMSRKINQYSHWMDTDDLFQEGLIGYVTAKDDKAALLAARRQMINALRDSYPGGRHHFCDANIEQSYDEKILETFLAPSHASQEDDLFVRQVLNAMPPREKNVLGLYFTGYTEKEIGKKLNLTESRISQIRKIIREKYFPQIMEIKTMAIKKRVAKFGVCSKCGEDKKLYAKGKCTNCYERDRRFAKREITPTVEKLKVQKNSLAAALEEQKVIVLPVFDIDTCTWRKQLDDALASAYQNGFQAGLESGRDQMKRALTEYMQKVESGEKL